MNEREATEYFLQLYPKCGLKTVAVFGLDITPFLKFGFRDVQYEPKEGEFDCVAVIGWKGMIKTDMIKKDGLTITDSIVLSGGLVQIHSGILNAYKRKA